MELPEKNKEVPLAEIKKIYEEFGLMDLWAKIEKDPLPDPSRAMDVPCSLIHGKESIFIQPVFPMTSNTGAGTPMKRPSG